MRAVFQHVKVNYILLEDGDKEATVDAIILQNGEEVETKFFMNLSDLNVMFNKFQTLGVEISLSENFQAYETDNGFLYTLDMKNYGWENVCVEELSFDHSIKQIRA